MADGSGATLLIRGGANSGVTIQLAGHAVTIGRRSDNDVVIDETTISRRHSLIMEAPDGFILRDLNTTNGTFVNRIKIGQTDYPLRHGDQISLGGQRGDADVPSGGATHTSGRDRRCTRADTGAGTGECAWR